MKLIDCKIVNGELRLDSSQLNIFNCYLTPRVILTEAEAEERGISRPCYTTIDGLRCSIDVIDKFGKSKTPSLFRRFLSIIMQKPITWK